MKGVAIVLNNEVKDNHVEVIIYGLTKTKEEEIIDKIVEISEEKGFVRVVDFEIPISKFFDEES